jgi:hypothetical protein
MALSTRAGQYSPFNEGQTGPLPAGSSQSLPYSEGYSYDAKTGQWVKQPAVDQTSPFDKSVMALSRLGMGGAFSGATGSSSIPWGASGMSLPPQVSGPSAGATIQSGATPPRIADTQDPARIAHIQTPDMTAANAAAFARAKDQVGQTSRGALTGLAGAMAGRGISGSGVEGRGITSVINQGQGQLGDVSRQQAIEQAQLAEQNALAGYQGDISQRATDIGSMDTRRGQDIGQRGQDISAQEAATNSLVAQRAQDQAMAGLGYQGGITQRGQDIGASQNAQELAMRRQQQIMQALQGLQF